MRAPVSIRPTTREDVVRLAGIAEAAGLFPSAFMAAMIEPFLDGAVEHLWLTAERAGSPAGFGFCELERFTNGTWNLRAIAVHTTVQNQGVGSALIESIETLLRTAEHRLLIVETTDAAEHERARAFYEARGYIKDGTVTDFWDAGVGKVIYRKQL